MSLPQRANTFTLPHRRELLLIESNGCSHGGSRLGAVRIETRTSSLTPASWALKKLCNCDVRLLAVLNGLNSIAMIATLRFIVSIFAPSHFYNVSCTCPQ
ncbi:Uncharacterised protein [Shigella flexneri]|nr:Uncharacterised protein [Shigella flexneri]